MSLFGLKLFCEPRFGSGGLVLVNYPLAGGNIDKTRNFPKFGGFIPTLLFGLEFLNGCTKRGLYFAISLTVAFCGLHSLGRGFVCRQSNLLSKIPIKKQI